MSLKVDGPPVLKRTAYICCKVEIHPLSITCPVLQSTVELSGNAMESQSQLILVACVVRTVTVWNNPYVLQCSCFYIYKTPRPTDYAEQ